MFSSENWAQTKAISSSFKSADMKSLGRITGVTFKDRVTNDAVIKLTVLIDLFRPQARSRVRWFGQVQQRENDHALKSTVRVLVPRKRLAGRLKKRWIDCVKWKLISLSLVHTYYLDRLAWEKVLSSIK